MPVSHTCYSFSSWKTFFVLVPAICSMHWSHCPLCMYYINMCHPLFIYIYELHRKWLLKVLCFNMIVKSIVHCEPFKMHKAVLRVLFIMYCTIHSQLVSYETLTPLSCTDNTHWFLPEQFNVKWAVCVSRQHKLLHNQWLSASEVWCQQTTWAITSNNIYVTWIYIHVGSITKSLYHIQQ